MNLEKYQVYVVCQDCGHWSFIQGTKESYGNVTKNQHCESCGSGRLDPQSVTSKRTFDVSRAKSRSSKIVKEVSKRSKD